MERSHPIDGVSVIVAAYNAARRLPRTLEHLAAQKMPADIPWEVILVDNNSNDGTSEVTKQEWQRLGSPAPLLLLNEPKQGVGHARVAALEKARFEYVVFCDDDNWLEPGYLSGMRDFLISRPDVGVVSGLTLPAADRELPAWFLENALYYTCAPRAEESCDVTESNWMAGAGMGLRLSTVKRMLAAGFPRFAAGRTGERLLSGEDVEICLWHRLIGQGLWFEKSLALRHFMEDHRLTPEYLERLKDGLAESRPAAMAFTEVVWGLEFKERGLPFTLKLLAKLLVKPLFGKTVQAEAVALRPATKPFLSRETRQILEALERYQESGHR